MAGKRIVGPVFSSSSRSRYVLLILGALAGMLSANSVFSSQGTRPQARGGPLPAAPRVGPASGSLVIVGGAMKNPLILRRFMDLAGGSRAAIVVIPTALEGDLKPLLDSFAEPFRQAGARQVTVLHTRNPAEADRAVFSAPLEHATGVWFTGGRQWRLVDAYAGTRTERAFHNLLARGGVIGGSSAGATIQGSYLVRGDPSGNTIMMSPGHERGFGFLRGAAIDQHVIARHRQNDLIPVIEAHPDLLGLGIDEDTALVVHGDMAEVIGSSQVLIYDYTQFGTKMAGDNADQDHHLNRDVRPEDTAALPSSEASDQGRKRTAPSTGSAHSSKTLYLALHPGDRFDLAGRKVLPGSER